MSKQKQKGRNPLKERRKAEFAPPEIYISVVSSLSSSSAVSTFQLLVSNPPLPLQQQESPEIGISEEFSAGKNFQSAPLQIPEGETFVMSLLFTDSQSLQYCLGRAHLHYEGRQLKGPLKGVNFPAEKWKAWKESTAMTITANNENIVDDCTREGESFLSNVLALEGLNENVVYIIASLQNDHSSLLHEWAHSIYYLNESYRKTVFEMWTGLEESVRVAIEKDLTLRNYSHLVIVDEFQAYLVESPLDFGKRWKDALLPIHTKLKALLPKASIGKGTAIIQILLQNTTCE